MMDTTDAPQLPFAALDRMRGIRTFVLAFDILPPDLEGDLALATYEGSLGIQILGLRFALTCDLAARVQAAAEARGWLVSGGPTTTGAGVELIRHLSPTALATELRALPLWQHPGLKVMTQVEGEYWQVEKPPALRQ